ncbi:MAG: S8 family serine peptidase [Acidobacteriia bacterium]|nr:S8 family serine peptidase [Terriglobia bacterium]
MAAQAFDSLIAKAEAGGSVRVIVGLRMNFHPEGQLGDAAVVQLQRSSIARAQDALIAQMTASNIQSLRRFSFIPYLAIEVDAAGLQLLKSFPEVVSVEEDVPVPPALAESVPLIGGPAAWASGFSGAGQTVAILDTGVDKTHPFLAGKVVSEACYSTTTANSTSLCPGGVQATTSPDSGINCDTLTMPICAHGTHVAGIAAGKANGAIGFSGVAKDANIISIQIFSRFDNPVDCGGSAPCVLSYDSDQIFALQRVQELSSSLSIAAVNLSLGGGQFFAFCDSQSPAVKAAIDSLRSLGIATVIASGNNGFNDSLNSPACISSAISVGSTDDGSSGTRADTISSFSNSAFFLNLLAPGRWITSSIPGGVFATEAGTSMSAPHVTGAWAIVKSKAPAATVDQVLSALSSTGLPLTDPRNGITKPRIRVDSALGALGVAQYAPGTVVNITATPGAGFVLRNWTFCDSVSGNICTVVMDQNKNVTANFEPGIPPLTSTEAATNITANGVTLNATVNPNGAATAVWFEWGIDSTLSTFTTTPPQQAGSVFDPVVISGEVNGLVATTPYYFRAASSNSFGASKGLIQSFTTQTSCSTIVPARESFSAAGGSSSVGVTAASTCSWTAVSSDTSFIAITAGSGGSGNGVVSYSVAANSSADIRSGTIIIGNMTILVLQGAQFNDVLLGDPFYTYIGKLSAEGLTAGCGNGNYCPDAPVTREQAAILIEKGLGVFIPPSPLQQTFADVPSTRFSYPFVEDFTARGLTAGCGTNPLSYCPDASVTREQIAIFIEKALGVTVPPTPVQQIFQDVPATSFSYPFIEDFFARGITAGCNTDPLLYCPTSPVTRGQIAVFLVRAFGL